MEDIKMGRRKKKTYWNHMFPGYVTNSIDSDGFRSDLVNPKACLD